MTKGLRSIRSLPRESLRVVPAVVGKRLPKFENVDPKTLYVEDSYQRAIMERGTALIRKIIAEFSWSRFKPPICVRLADSGNILVCIDGQHTATATASHGGIEKIPVMIVDAADVPARAAAFVGHNKDRIALTTVMIHAAELAAGDALAVAIDDACRRAGASIPRKSQGSKEAQTVGATISIGTLRAIVKQQGSEALVRVLKILVQAGRAPIKSAEIAATALICNVHGVSIDAKLAKVIASRTTEVWTAEGQIEGLGFGKGVAVGIADLWCTSLGIEPPEVTIKGHTYDHARLFTKPPEAKPAVPPEKASAAPKPEPQVKPILEKEPQPQKPPKIDWSTEPHPIREPPKPTSNITENIQPPAPKPDPSRFVERNGIKIDLKTGELVHRDRVVVLPHGEHLSLVVMLARVAPALLDHSRVIAKVFGVGMERGPELLRDLVAEVNPGLRRVSLEVRSVPKAGVTLASLG